MSDKSDETPPEPITPVKPIAPDARTARRFAMLSALRFVSVAAVMAGFAITYDAISAPKAIGIVLALGGMFGFFFGPKFLVQGWRSEDQ